MDILFLESNTFVLEDLRIKLEEKLFKNFKFKPLIFFNQLDSYAEKGLEKHQKKVLTKLIKSNKVVVIYIRQSVALGESYDEFFLRTLRDMGVKYITIVDILQYLDDDYVIDRILNIYKRGFINVSSS